MSAAHTPHDDVMPHVAHDLKSADIDRVLSSDVVSYCISAVPAAYVVTTDIIIRDTAGRSFMLTPGSSEPVPLGREELDVLGMAYEPAQDTSWHTAAELRRMFFGEQEA